MVKYTTWSYMQILSLKEGFLNDLGSVKGNEQCLTL